MKRLSRRSWLQVAGLGSFAGGTARIASRSVSAQEAGDDVPQRSHQMGAVGRVSTESFDPSVFLRTWNFSDLSQVERRRFYRETPREDGTMLREYELFSVDREIEIAPGSSFQLGPTTGRCLVRPFAQPKAIGLGSIFSIRVPIHTRFTFTAGILLK